MFTGYDVSVACLWGFSVQGFPVKKLTSLNLTGCFEVGGHLKGCFVGTSAV